MKLNGSSVLQLLHVQLRHGDGVHVRVVERGLVPLRQKVLQSLAAHVVFAQPAEDHRHRYLALAEARQRDLAGQPPQRLLVAALHLVLGHLDLEHDLVFGDRLDLGLHVGSPFIAQRGHRLWLRWCGREDLNLHEQSSLDPKSSASTSSATPAPWIGCRWKIGVRDGIRTRDRQGHNLELYQLSYPHRRLCTPATGGLQTAPARAAYEDTTWAAAGHAPREGPPAAVHA